VFRPGENRSRGEGTMVSVDHIKNFEQEEENNEIISEGE